MGHFLKHEPCDKCGSRDNKAVYSDGTSYCFGCQSFLSSNFSHLLFQGKEKEEKAQAQRFLRVDIRPTYNHEMVAWAGQYSVSVEVLLSKGVGTNKERAALIFQWAAPQIQDNSFGAERMVPILQSARFFGETKLKYRTYGKVNEVLPIYYKNSPENRTNTLVLVEDALSSLKIARLCDSMPCLGSGVPPLKLKRLARLYSRFVVWLDGNMYPNAQKMARQLQMLGCEARAVYTPLDPKCYESVTMLDILGKDVVS